MRILGKLAFAHHEEQVAGYPTSKAMSDCSGWLAAFHSARYLVPLLLS
jgi:hypothetical protein